MARRKAKKTVQVKTNTHQDERVNIPTQELADFMTDDQKAPVKLSYPRDPSLDPQLVWKGKDEQDSEDLSVETRPIYIQEKIHPQVVIENIKAEAKKKSLTADQMSLFGDFNGIEFEQMIDFYQHAQNWTNRFILGDSLQVMTSLAEKERLRGQVQMIYVDPPYGIKFGSNWQVSTRTNKVRDGRDADMTRQPEQVKAFRDTWELGIHSYLTYLRDRLTVARELLNESGSIFIQIGDENVHLIRSLMDEVFGSENFLALIPFKKTSSLGSKGLDGINDYLVWYGKSKEFTKYRQLYYDVGFDTYAFRHIEFNDGTWKRMSEKERRIFNTKDGRLFRTAGLTSQSGGDTTSFEYEINGQIYRPSRNYYWKTNISGMQKLHKAGRLVPSGKTLSYKRYQRDFSVRAITNWWNDTVQSTFAIENIFVVQTYSKVVARCLLMATDPGDLVLDPTCGSGTTSFVAEQWGRRWITIDTSRVALALARTRLMSSKFPFYVLSDSQEGVAIEAENRGQPPPTPTQPAENDLRRGFVYKTVPHIMLRHITNNEDIIDIYNRWEEGIRIVLDQINLLLSRPLLDWEIPLKPEDDWPDEIHDLFNKYWQLRRNRQTDIDASIAYNSDQEILYDQPYQSSKIVRVAGPFTVESLSPHRVLSPDQELSESEIVGHADTGQYEETIIANLRRAGVQNTKVNERLKFDRLEPYAGGLYLQAEGDYTESDDTSKRVAISLGPEHGTVGKEHIRAAARDAVKGLGFDLLLVCGFAFDPEVAVEVTQYGKLVVLPVKMNPDLSMGGTLLKKTGAGNLFMVFGEPDLKIEQNDDDRYVVTIEGLDIYDPTTGEIRSASTNDIACWFIDTNYNDQSFFVRHAYFTGGDDPYKRLKRTLRAEINEEAWSALYRTTSLPFDPPETGKIAVKVINHYGDEVLKVYEIA